MSCARPSPGFGGKSRVAPEIWRRFGDCPNYVEPFAGSLAVLLARPHAPKIETVSDKCHFIANFWRAVKLDPEAVAHHADWLVSEVDLNARHYWLVTQGAERLAAGVGDPDWHDAKIAGWWVWGACSWIGSGWCSGKGPWRWSADGWTKGNAGQGIKRKLPHLGDAGRGINRQANTLGMLTALSERLRGVRVCCGDWSRIMGESVTIKHGMTAVLLDPPYSDPATDSDAIYSVDCGDVARKAAAWARANGDNPLYRIALCGYEGEHDMPGWTEHRWKANGGYGNQGEGLSLIHI